jgi:hypothetical protein
MSPTVSGTDLIDALANVPPDSALGRLRRERSAATEHMPGSYAALFDPAELVGLSQAERLAVAQVIAFVSFMVRVLKALELLGAQHSPAPSTFATSQTAAASPPGEPAHVIQPPADLKRPTQFTVEQLAWTAWLEPLDLDTATPEQLAALEVGLQELEIFDVLHAGAFFAWANRLMLTLGEPYFEFAQ